MDSAERMMAIEKLDMFTLQHIFTVVSNMDIKQFNIHENRTPYSEGENYGYRTVLGELSRLIEHKKVMNKIIKDRRNKQK